MNRGCGPANSPVSRSSPGPKVVLKPANPTFSRLKALKSSADSWTNARSVKGMFFITLMSKFDIPRLRKALPLRNAPGALSPRSPPLDRSPFRSRPARGLMGGPEVMRAIPDQVMPNGSPRTALDVDWWRMSWLQSATSGFTNTRFAAVSTGLVWAYCGRGAEQSDPLPQWGIGYGLKGNEVPASRR